MLRAARSFALSIPFLLLSVACGGGGATGSGGSAATTSGDTSSSTGSSHTTSSTGGSTSTSTSGTGGSVPTSPYHLVGRFDESDPARPTASWSGTTLRTRIKGSSLSVSLGGAKSVIFQIEVDGQPAGKLTTLGGDQTYDVVTGLPAGEH
jgi:hypothetical protein